MRCITVSILALAVCAAKGADDLKPGLIGEYFDMGGAVEDFPKVDDKKPAVHFYVRWTGVLRVEKAGPYTLYTESDDGSRLWIDGKQVVDNGGLHGMEERSGKVELTAGDHEIKIDLFENEGEVGMKVSWQADGGEKKIIPAGAYFHKADEKLDKN